MVKARVAFLALCLAACSRESTRVREARDSFYAALSRRDYSAIRAAVAPDYVSVDRGRFFGLDSLIADVILLEQESLATRYSFVDSAIRVDPPLAWVVYHGRKILTRPDFADTSFTVESATFRRDGGGWKLTLLHRTPLAGGEGYFDTGSVVAPATPGPTARAAGRAGNPGPGRTAGR